MFEKNKYYTDKTFLVKILDTNEDTLKVEIVDTDKEHKDKLGLITDVPVERALRFLVEYDLNNPLTKIVNRGKCYCEECNRELHLGDSCVKYDDMCFCDEYCLLDWLCYDKDETINENDLDDSVTEEVHLFKDFKVEEN